MSSLSEAFRLLARRPTFVVAVVAVVGFGVGAATAIYSTVSSVLLRPLPYNQPEELVMLWSEVKGQRTRRGIATQQQFLLWRDFGTSFTDLAAVEPWPASAGVGFDLSGPDGPERLSGARASLNFFALLGVKAAIGQTFSNSYGVDSDVAVISHGLWSRMFGADPTVVGRGVRMVYGRRDRVERMVTIIGVLPRGFKYSYPDETEVWLPIPWSAIEPSSRGGVLYQVVGRLRSGTSVLSAQSDVPRMLNAIAGELKDSKYGERRDIRIEPIHDYQIGSVTEAMRFTSIAIAIVLLITVTSLAHLFVARSIERLNEMSTRLTLGAMQSRIGILILAEGLLLGLVSSVAASFFAFVSLPILALAIPKSIPRFNELSVDGWALGGSLVLSILAVILALGAAVPIVLTKSATFIRRGQTSTDSSRIMWVHRIMTSVQIAVVCVLLVVSGYLVKSLLNLRSAPLGFTADGITILELRLLDTKYRDPNYLVGFQRELIEKARALPGVVDVAMTSAVPFRGIDWFATISSPDSLNNKPVAGNMRQVDSNYFRMMNIPIREGRVFSDSDTRQSAGVSIVSASLSRALFAGTPPIGKMLGTDPGTEIIGVVGDVRSRRVDEEPGHAFYLSREQAPSELVCLLVRAPRTDIRLPLRSVVASIDSSLPVQRITPLSEIVSDVTALQRFYAVIATSLAAFAALSAAIGLGALTSQASQRRSREIGIRIALGATEQRVIRLVLAGTFRVVLFGVAAGAVLAYWSTRLIETVFFQVPALDPGIFGLALLGIMVICACAAYIPARRAVSTDPTKVLNDW